ncbi:MAG: hypothetical protein LBM02_09800 [Lachnospiraceae bacterium]|jgi:hypothetical protein|nr:hypothetical protein [Lachnospiraceae bacterium]
MKSKQEITDAVLNERTKLVSYIDQLKLKIKGVENLKVIKLWDDVITKNNLKIDVIKSDYISIEVNGYFKIFLHEKCITSTIADDKVVEVSIHNEPGYILNYELNLLYEFINLTLKENCTCYIIDKIHVENNDGKIIEIDPLVCKDYVNIKRRLEECYYTLNTGDEYLREFNDSIVLNFEDDIISDDKIKFNKTVYTPGGYSCKYFDLIYRYDKDNVDDEVVEHIGIIHNKPYFLNISSEIYFKKYIERLDFKRGLKYKHYIELKRNQYVDIDEFIERVYKYEMLNLYPLTQILN